MPNLVPLVIAAGAAAVLFGKKKKRRKSTAAPPGPDIPPLPGEREPEGGEEGAGETADEPDGPPGETGMTGSEHEPLEPGRAVASGIEMHASGAYPWKIIVTEASDYAGHYYPMGHRGPHEEVVRGATVEEAIAAFKSWAESEDRRKRNLPPLLTKHASVVSGEPQDATPQDQDEGGGAGDVGS